MLMSKFDVVAFDQSPRELMFFVYCIGGVSINDGYPNGRMVEWKILLKWFKMDDLGVPLFPETSIYIYIYIYSIFVNLLKHYKKCTVCVLYAIYWQYLYLYLLYCNSYTDEWWLENRTLQVLELEDDVGTSGSMGSWNVALAFSYVYIYIYICIHFFFFKNRHNYG